MPAVFAVHVDGKLNAICTSIGDTVDVVQQIAPSVRDWERIYTIMRGQFERGAAMIHTQHGRIDVIRYAANVPDGAVPDHLKDRPTES